jgi:tetratricopeptide (TPR) repeat protein
VTFSPLEDRHPTDRPGFGEAFLQRSGIDAIHVVPCGNHWYQYPELPKMCAQIAAITAQYRHVVAYGSSMGGYAAIRYGGWLGADVALALSPQLTINPWRRPFERRWLAYAKKIRFQFESGQTTTKNAIVVYDPLGPDRVHAELFKAITDVIPVPLPYSGHPSTGFLADLGLLQPLLLDVCYGTFVAKQVIDNAIRLSEDSPQFHNERIRRTAHRDARYKLALGAAARWPTHVPTLHALSIVAMKVGHSEFAIATLQKAAVLEPNTTSTQFLLSLAYKSAGRLEAAIEIMENLCQRDTDSPVYRTALTKLKRRKALQTIIQHYGRWSASNPS